MFELPSLMSAEQRKTYPLTIRIDSTVLAIAHFVKIVSTVNSRLAGTYLFS
jgi:hypothetical protein